MSALYRTQAINEDGADGESRIPGGISVAVASPVPTTATAPGATASNPEQLLALAWATCLNATTQAVMGRRARSTVRVEVELHPAEPGPGFVFHIDAFVSVEGADPEETDRIAREADARCPVSKLLRGAADVRVHAEDYLTPSR